MHLLNRYFFRSMFYRSIVNLRIIRGRSKHLVLYNKQNLFVFDRYLIFGLLTI